MAGGLMQLVAYGAQDVYLTGQPKVTFFQAVYKRHTNFAMENIIQTVNGTPSNGGRVSVTIARNGDLVGNMYVALQPNVLAATSTNGVADRNWVAERAVQDVELTIGGQRIDKHYQTWWRLYSELFLNEPDKTQWAKMTTPSNRSETTDRVYLPLLFFFNRNPGLYLPLIALQYHDVRLDFNLTNYFSTFFSTSRFEVWANYVYLDTEERRRFAQKGHEYLIEQLQHTGADPVTVSTGSTPTEQLVRLSYNHPVKELIWCYTDATFPGNASDTTSATGAMNSVWNFTTNCANVNVTSNLWLFQSANNYVQPHVCGVPHIYSGGSAALKASNAYWTEDGITRPGTDDNVEVGPLANFRLILNGQDRFATQPGKYFNQIQPFYHHTGTPYPGIYVYSFALQPEEHQPTGTCNFSRIDNAQVAVSLKVASRSNQQRMFAVNYNILRIQSGMGGLAFSN
jgi:hypothetical protein